MNRSYALRLLALALPFAVLSVVGCSTDADTKDAPGLASPDGGSDREASVEDAPDGSTPDDSTKDGSVDAQPDVDEPLPASPFFEVKINGQTIPVTGVEVTTSVFTDAMIGWTGVHYYKIKALLARTPPIVPDLNEDPYMVITATEDQVGMDVCKKKLGPLTDNGDVPVLESREVMVYYSRSTGNVGWPSTESGGCDMLLKRAASTGNAWGEATGWLPVGAGPEKLQFEVKWFQPVRWD